jgi:hypothetical protein
MPNLWLKKLIGSLIWWKQRKFLPSKFVHLLSFTCEIFVSLKYRKRERKRELQQMFSTLKKQKIHCISSCLPLTNKQKKHFSLVFSYERYHFSNKLLLLEKCPFWRKEVV